VFIDFLLETRLYSVYHHSTRHNIPRIYTHTRHLSRRNIPRTMDQQQNARAPSHNESTRTMDLTSVMPQRIQLTRNAPRRQTPPHLPSPPSVSQRSRPLPSIPTSVRIESQNPIFSSHNIENRHFASNNIENRQFLPTNQAFSSHNNQYHPLYDTQAFSSTYVNLPTGPPLYHSNQNNVNTQRVQHNLLSPTPLPSLPYPFLSTLPTIKELPTPSSPTYIPILTGRSDWCSDGHG
jgi:hypothetical protein